MSDLDSLSFYDIYCQQASVHGDAVAIQAPKAADLSYSGLVAQMDKVIAALSAWNIGHGDRVVVQLPSGPVPLILMQGVATLAVVMLINPQAGDIEADYLLQFVQPKAIIVQQGLESSGRAAAQALGVRVIEIIPTPDNGAGTFIFADLIPTAVEWLPLNAPDDLAFLIPTSGTTALPKLMPKSQRNMIVGIDEFLMLHAEVLDESTPLVTLNFLPMHLAYAFWISVAALISGGKVACLPGLDPETYYLHMDHYQPNFLAGPPPILEPLLAAAPRFADILARHSICYINAGSATVSGSMRAGVNRVFCVPIVQMYGSTEVGLISKVILPAGRVDPVTSLGPPEHPDHTRIMASDGSFLPRGEAGEIVLKTNAFNGYWNNPEANADAFMNGWFRTGDEGIIDADGNLQLLGRLKEVINSGGAKVSPSEVEAVLKQHPQVTDVAVFGIRHAEIGETVGAAVVGTVTERELRKFAAERLPFYKVPMRIVVVDAIPTTALGKVPRNRLAELLGLT